MVFANSENYNKLLSGENCAVHCQNNLTSPIPKHLKATTNHPHISHLSNYTLKNSVKSKNCKFFHPQAVTHFIHLFCNH